MFALKDIIKKVKRQHVEWKKLFANHISNKSLLSRIYKNTYNSAMKRQKPGFIKMGKGFKLTFH